MGNHVTILKYVFFIPKFHFIVQDFKILQLFCHDDQFDSVGVNSYCRKQTLFNFKSRILCHVNESLKAMLCFMDS